MTAGPRPAWRLMLLAALGPASLELWWLLYNTYVPLWLQAGHPDFLAASGASLTGFGLGAFATGVILTGGNLLALAITPLVGVLSDTTRTRWGRRKPWIALPALAALTGLSLLPLLAKGPGLAGFLMALALLLSALAVMRTPATALLYDVTPSQLRGLAAAMSGVVGGLAAVGGAVIGALLFDVYPPLPFWGAAGLAGIALGAICWRVPEPPPATSLRPQSAVTGHLVQLWQELPPAQARSIALLFGNIWLTFGAFGTFQAFVSSYSVSVLGLTPGEAAWLYATGAGAFLVAAFPASWIAGRLLTRRRTVLLGAVGSVGSALAIFLLQDVGWIWANVVLNGASLALVMINQEPMMMDSAPSDEWLGTFAALMQIARYLANVAVPILAGGLVQAAGHDYNQIWLIMAALGLAALILMLPVTTGEARAPQSTPATQDQPGIYLKEAHNERTKKGHPDDPLQES